MSSMTLDPPPAVMGVLDNGRLVDGGEDAVDDHVEMQWLVR